MNKLVATVKANKQIIIRRTLVVVGVAAGLGLVGYIATKSASEDELLVDLEIPDTQL